MIDHIWATTYEKTYMMNHIWATTYDKTYMMSYHMRLTIYDGPYMGNYIRQGTHDGPLFQIKQSECPFLRHHCIRVVLSLYPCGLIISKYS